VNGFKVRICCPNSGAYRIISMEKLKDPKYRSYSIEILKPLALKGELEYEFNILVKLI